MSEPITTIVFDFARVLWFPKESITTSLERYYHQLQESDPHAGFALNDELLHHINDWKEHYTTAILTASGMVLGEDSPIRSQLKPYFHFIFTTRDYDGLNKTNAAIYTALAKRVEVKPGTILFIDDSAANIAAAKNAGFQTVHFRSNEESIPEIVGKL